MKIQRTPAPFPSTILSLSDAEQFRYRSTTIQAVTISPTNPEAPYTLSGESALLHRLQTYDVQVLPPGIPALTRSVAEAELSRYATPVPRAASHPDAEAVRTSQRLAAPGPAPSTSQQHAIRANAHLTPAPPAPAPALRPVPGKHRA